MTATVLRRSDSITVTVADESGDKLKFLILSPAPDLDEALGGEPIEILVTPDLTRESIGLVALSPADVTALVRAVDEMRERARPVRPHHRPEFYDGE